MPGGREITGADVRAALAVPAWASLAPGALRALESAVAGDDVFSSYEELAMACPPERLGLSAGAHAAVFGPLFGEFE